ncbi:hypothetical protein BLL52_3405 [Rhodoferax antarcticus ANT.BR]|uniref:Uncharacterized protein n=1 Tax=Rhodoferax antarcticus ANT.BR TaxID=1111071 RepID=A0A1Q8YBU2_9BURK|nr:hypothetical protein BLL52_3405 [Rhodoferax antarcticus ANT.BR]
MRLNFLSFQIYIVIGNGPMASRIKHALQVFALPVWYHRRAIPPGLRPASEAQRR